MIVGFTGTRKGMTQAQACSVRVWLLAHKPSSVHHGDCVGADATFHWIASSITKVVIHPGCEVGDKRRAGCTGGLVTIKPVKPFLVRNREIVDASDWMLVVPKWNKEETRSGTWATYRYAQKTGKTVTIVWPDGREETRVVLQGEVR